MKIIADTNLLVRAIVADDPAQSTLAQAELENAEVVAITLPALCELGWVLLRGYEVGRADLAEMLRRLLASANVEVDRPAVESGLRLLQAGGDFADGVIAHEGRWLGGEVFVSFDRKAVQHLTDFGEQARVPR
ncbi:type II toxin-antitoxin system VapC family toxin [Sphingomonas koreensis]